MKSSYFTTTRRMDEATFHAWGDPVEKPDDDGVHPAEVVALLVFIFALVMMALGVLA